MDVTKWKSVAIRKAVNDKFKKICKKEKRSPSAQLEMLMDLYKESTKKVVMPEPTVLPK
tara:strand:+ start:141 stop:317 length:177 start_codon:yes stop_codon:yes gene_type:complete